MDCLKGLPDIPRPDLIVTDPPYEFDAMGGGIHKVGNGGKVRYQDIIDIGTNHFNFEAYVPKILDLQDNKINAYFFCNKTLVPRYLREAQTRKLHFDILAIRKLNPIPAKNSAYLPELEYIIFLRSKGVYFDGTLDFDYYHKIFDKHNTPNRYHPNEKPVSLLKRFITISSPVGGLVLDPFLGSGSTVVATKELNRHFIGFEINSIFYETALKRLSMVDYSIFNWGRNDS
jgi:site-specific DNA-methyltransferase (adenine-specific)